MLATVRIFERDAELHAGRNSDSLVRSR
jgi:hypothetical protein